MTTLRKTSPQLIEDNQGLVIFLARKVHRGLPEHIEVDDLIGYGQIGLAEAARDFDPDRGNDFTTFAYYRIRGAIHDGLSRMFWFSRAHYNRVRFEQMANEVLRYEAAAETPAASAGLADDVMWFRGLCSTLAVVHLATHGDEDESGPAMLVDPAAPAPPAVAMGREVGGVLRQLIDALPADAGQLIRGTYFEGLTLQEAGRRLGMSKSWASRLHAKTLQQLARSLRVVGYDE